MDWLLDLMEMEPLIKKKMFVRCNERFFGKQCTLLEDHKERGLKHHSFVMRFEKEIVRYNELAEIKKKRDTFLIEVREPVKIDRWMT